jgi:hypothetical protein
MLSRRAEQAVILDKVIETKTQRITCISFNIIVLRTVIWQGVNDPDSTQETSEYAG